MRALIKSTFNIVAAVIVFFAAIAIFVAKNTSSLMVSEAERTVRSVVKNTTERIDRMMAGVETAVINQKWIITEHLDDPDYMYKVTQELVDNNEFIVGSTVAFKPYFYKSKGRLYSPYSCHDEKGKLKSFTLPYEYPEYEWYKAVWESGKARWSEPYFDEGGGGIDMSTYSVPIHDNQGKICAILTADLSLERLKRHVASICPFPKSYAVMRSAQDKLLVGPSKEQLEGDRTGKSISIRDQADNGWSIEVICPVEEVLSGSRKLVIRIIIFSILGLVMIFIVSWIYSSRLQRSVALRERMEGELNTARTIQADILSTEFPYNVHALLRPAREVGGDIYDFVLSGDRLYFIIGDASGKGVPAALFAFMAGTVFRMSCTDELDPGETVRRINEALTHNNRMSMFVTAFVGVLDMKTGVLEFCNAGHNPPIVIAPIGKAEFLDVKRNLPTGVQMDVSYGVQTKKLEPGTRILAYTDGVTEAERMDHTQFGNGRLLEFASTCGAMPVGEVSTGLLNAVDGFVSGAEQYDDITIMAIISR